MNCVIVIMVIPEKSVAILWLSNGEIIELRVMNPVLNISQCRNFLRKVGKLKNWIFDIEMMVGMVKRKLRSTA